MKSETYPLTMPPQLMDEVRRTARYTSLSVADAMRQSIRLGLPKLRKQPRVADLKPLNSNEIKAAFKPDHEWEALESAMTTPEWKTMSTSKIHRS